MKDRYAKSFWLLIRPLRVLAVGGILLTFLSATGIVTKFAKLAVSNIFTQANTFNSDVTIGNSVAEDTFILQAKTEDLGRVEARFTDIDVVMSGGVETVTAKTITVVGGTIGPNGWMVVNVDAAQSCCNDLVLEIKFGSAFLSRTGSGTVGDAFSTIARFWNQGSETLNFRTGRGVAAGYYYVVFDEDDVNVDTSGNLDITVNIVGSATTTAGTQVVKGISVVIFHGS